MPYFVGGLDRGGLRQIHIGEAFITMNNEEKEIILISVPKVLTLKAQPANLIVEMATRTIIMDVYSDDIRIT